MSTQLFMSLKNEKPLEHQSVKVNGKLYNLMNSQLSTNDESNFEEYHLVAINNLSSLTNGFIDFKLNAIPVNCLIKSLTLKFTLSNNSSTTANYVLPLSHYIRSTEILVQGVSVFSDNSSWSNYLDNTLRYDKNTSSGYRMLFFSGHIPDSQSHLFSPNIAKSSSFDVNLRLNNIFSHVGCFLPLLTKSGAEVIFRVNFNSFLTNANDADFSINQPILKVNANKISNNLKNNLLRQPQLSYRFIQPIVRSYQFSSLTDGSEYEILLTSYNYLTTCLFINITSTTASNKIDRYTKMYSISKLKLLDEFGNSYCQNNYYETYNDLYYNAFKFHFPNSSFFDTDNGQAWPNFQANNMTCLPFWSNVNSDIFKHTFNGAIQIKPNSKLVLTCDETCTNASVNIVFFSPSILNLEPGKLEVINSSTMI